jgi:hypothetical protein
MIFSMIFPDARADERSPPRRLGTRVTISNADHGPVGAIKIESNGVSPDDSLLLDV